MTAGELLDDITDCVEPGEDSQDEAEHGIGCTCIEKIEQYRAEQQRKTLLELARWVGPQNIFMGSHDLQELANDPERLKKLMEEADK